MSGMVVTIELCKHSEELRELFALNLLPTNDQNPLRDCQMTASDETLDSEGKEHPERHDCY